MKLDFVRRGVFAIVLGALTASAWAQSAAVSVWGVNSGGQVWRWAGTQWEMVPSPHPLRHVSVGSDGTVWAVARSGAIARRVGAQWQPVPGAAVQVSVGHAQNVWAVNANDDIYQWTGTQWQGVSGKLVNVSAAADGTVWGVNRTGGVYRRSGNDWQAMPAGPVQVSVGGAEQVWGVGPQGQVLRWVGGRWDTVSGVLRQVAVAADGTVWGVNAAGAIYRRAGEQWEMVQGGLAQVAVASSALLVVPSPGVQNIAPPSAGIGGNLVLNTPVITTPAPSPGTGVPVPGTPTGSSGQGGLVVGTPGGSGLVVSGGPLPNQPTPGAPLVVGGSMPAAAGPIGQSAAVCGGLNQPLCRTKSAVLERNASIECPAGSFPDLGRSSCWSCPSGYQRGIAAVDSARACTKPDSSVTGGFSSATFRGPLCPSGSFHDPIRGGECYSCPTGYSRSATHIDAPNACYVPISERFASATRHANTVWPHECRSGQFHDIWNGGACWSCPSGYRRTAYHVNNDNACVQTVAEQHARATLKQKAQCGPGEFFDLRVAGAQNPSYGGGCWTCPTAADRTIFPVDTHQACESTPRVAFHVATQVRGMTCEAEQIFDPVDSGASVMRDRLAQRNAELTQLGKTTIPAQTGKGTCWTCPPGTARTASTVYGDAACRPKGIEWRSAVYGQPGLFGLAGGEAVALQLVAERSVINTLADGLASAMGLSPAAARQQVWEEIATMPQSSSVLKLAVLSRVQHAARNSASATADERLLLQSVQQQAKAFRVFMAEDALAAYDAWHAGIDTRKSLLARSSLQTAFDVGDVPPDFEEITAATIMSGLATGGAISTAGTITMMNIQVFKAVFPHTLRASANLTQRSAQAVTTAFAKTVNAQIAAGAKFSSAIASQMLSVGPQVIIMVGTQILAVAIEQQIDIANARPKLLALVATARNNDFDVARLLGTAQGSSEVENQWTLMMAGAVLPRNLAAFQQHAATALAQR